MQKPRLSLGQIGNMSFGFLGIQFGWGLQLANMSAIYSYLGAKESAIPLLWLAGPVTGLIVQPIVGAMSDRTWNWLGRRRPYFLVGAILSEHRVVHHARFDKRANGCRALVGARCEHKYQHGAVPSLRCRQTGSGSAQCRLRHAEFLYRNRRPLANTLPYVFRYMGVSGTTASGIPLTVQYSFKIGAVVFLLAIL